MIKKSCFMIILFVFALSVCITGFSGCDPNKGDDGTDAEKPVLYIGLMVHLEGHRLDTLEKHNDYKNKILAYADLFDRHGARITWEVKEPIETCLAYNDYYFKGLEDRGHGIGVHADIGGNPNDAAYTYQMFVNDGLQKKTDLETQGVTVRHVSGVCSHLDWSGGVIEAGYDFVTGVVSYCFSSLPESLRPPEYADCDNPAVCHDPYPEKLKDRIHPWRASDRNWSQTDPNGSLVILPEAVNALRNLAEIKEDPETRGPFEFTEDDTGAYLEYLDEALSYVDPGKVNTFYLLWSFGSELDMDLLELWLKSIDGYVEAGTVQWATLPEMYDFFVEWEQKQQN